ncbi:SDR family oxidoreductase [Streptomyces sp. DSM 44917]|uniref:SDR family oxidoreductase n=1 Tax=Streptomyces boetiae TaxID=3075541 RepID=A0ABU2L3B4_9ACTN|nr:SDR family oxidoreductase [Streptomyces sp. DSM 44917]MDT0306061.1 SDR family oxidoreductase [Streptomyces sp. DSM 44917]
MSRRSGGLDLAGRRVFVTGAAGGIGRATALRAAAEGAELLLTDLDAAGLEATAAEIRAAGGTVPYARAADVSDHAAVRAMAEEIHAEGGAADVVMNVAGISTWGTVQTLENRHWRAMVEVNLMGPIHVIESFVPAMIEAGRGGHLVNVSSAAGLLGLPWHAAYSASKFGLRGVSEVLRFDLRRHRIGVTLVCPGAVNTPLTETVEIVGVDRRSPAFRRFQAAFRRRAATPEAVAEAILDGVRRGRYLVHTSRQVRVLHFLQRVAPPLYAVVMRLLSRVAFRVLGSATAPTTAAATDPSTTGAPREAR